jgi:hypothetical protein
MRPVFKRSSSHGIVPPIIGKDPEDGSIVIFDSGRTASFKGGQWQPGVLFHNDQILNDFRDVTDPIEVDRIMQEAADVLRRSTNKREVSD